MEINTQHSACIVDHPAPEMNAFDLYNIHVCVVVALNGFTEALVHSRLHFIGQGLKKGLLPAIAYLKENVPSSNMCGLVDVVCRSNLCEII